MTPNIWFKITFIIIGCLFCAFLGWYPEHLELINYKEKVLEDAKAQEQHNKDLEKQRGLENAKKDSDYANQLASIERMYNARISSMPKPSNTLVKVNGYTTDPVFAELCANTTAQLIELQQWVKDQVGLK